MSAFTDSIDRSYELYRKARGHLGAGELEVAAELLEQSVVLNPHFKSLELLGEVRARLGQLELAVPPLAAATALNAQGRAPAILADVFQRLGDDDRAREFASLALERSPNNGLALEVLDRLKSSSDADS